MKVVKKSGGTIEIDADDIEDITFVAKETPKGSNEICYAFWCEMGNRKSAI